MEKTFALIKPDAVERNIIGNIIATIEKNHFIISNLKLFKFTISDAQKFYEIHKDKPFFDNLIEYMTSGNIIALELQKKNAVAEFRELLGSTDPKEAKENTIRKMYALDKTHNSVHGSDSIVNAEKEISLIFGT